MQDFVWTAYDKLVSESMLRDKFSGTRTLRKPCCLVGVAARFLVVPCPLLLPLTHYHSPLVGRASLLLYTAA